MTTSEPSTTPPVTWQRPDYTEQAGWQPNTAPPPPVPGSYDPNTPTQQALRRVMSQQRASGFDRDLKTGTALLAISIFVVPIVFGTGAAYCGYRSHKAGNPIGQVFAIGSLVLTAVNIMVVASILLPRLLQ